MRKAKIALWALLIATLGAAPVAKAQYFPIPLYTLQDQNGVDLYSGNIYAILPGLSIGASSMGGLSRNVFVQPPGGQGSGGQLGRNDNFDDWRRWHRECWRDVHCEFQ